MPNRRFIDLKNTTMRIRDRLILAHTSWEIRRGQQWAVIGPNGAGKTSLVKALIGETPVVRGRIRRHHPMSRPVAIGYVSFEQHQKIIHREEDRDEARFFAGRLDDYLRTAELLFGAGPKHKAGDPSATRIINRMGVAHLLDRGVRFLSTGEIRKVLIARALLKSPLLLILDEPFAGLDKRSRRRLTDTLRDLMRKGTQIILVTHRWEQIPPEISHVIYLREGRVVLKGKRRDVLNNKNIPGMCQNEPSPARPGCPGRPLRKHRYGKETPVLVRMKNVSVVYGGIQVLKNFSWTVRRGENWAVYGENGSGKTTLLNLITGGHLQAYANEIYLWGRRRGTGESVWEIKERVGLVSSEMQIDYRKSIQCIDVVLSGFFDSVGLYRSATPRQGEKARRWMDRLNLGPLMHRRMDHLSYGEKRLVLLARAMVKSPEMLCLDEPCHGLDPLNRQRVIDLVDYIGKETDTQLLYVTHYKDEKPACVTRELYLDHSP